MQVLNRPDGDRVTCRVLGLHCAEEVALLRRALGRHDGVADVHVDQVRAEVSFRLAAPATMASVSSVVSRAGLRLVHATEAGPADGVDPRIWWAGVSSNALLLVAMLIQFLASGGDWMSLVADAEVRDLHVAALAAYVLAAASAAVVILPKAASSLRHARLDMNVLVVVAAAGAAWLGELSEAAMVAGLFTGAHLLESWSAARARRAVGALMQGTPTDVCCQVDGREHRTPIAAVTPGMVLLIRPGERIPIDAEIVAGSSNLDESALTGEPTSVHRAAGDRVTAGSINGSGSLEIRALARADDSDLARMLSAVERTRQGQTSAERWVEAFARVYTPIVVGLALLVWLVPPLLGSGTFEEWFRRGLVVTLVACPCALVVSTPLTIVAAISTAARAGILVKKGEDLERCAALTCVAFDKTGVATTGQLQVLSLQVFEPFDERLTLERVVALESRSEHPLAEALIDYAVARGIDPAARAGHSVQAVPGLGLEGDVDGADFWIGSARFLGRHATVTSDAAAAIGALREQGLTVVACGSGSQMWALFGALDTTRPDAVDAARALRERGVRHLALLSGDHAAAVRATATLMHVDDIRGECTPEDKAIAIRDLQTRGPAAMIGDGINDVPALAAASLGVAVGPRATDAALESADIVLIHDDLMRLPWLVDHARRTLSLVRQNLWLALLMKVGFLAAAAAGHATLWMAVLADTGATLLVTMNGLRMLRDAHMPAAPPHVHHRHETRSAPAVHHHSTPHRCDHTHAH